MNELQKLVLDYNVIIPEVIVALVGVIIMVVDAYSGRRARATSAWLALAGLGGALFWSVWMVWRPLVGEFGVIFASESWAGMLVTDPLRMIFLLITLAVSALTVLASMNWLDEDDLPAGEFYALLMFATVGMMLMAGAADLVMVFLGLEILSIATYVMAGFRRRDLRSNESALKYYILGSFATAFLLYGMALVYGATRTTNLGAIRLAIGGGDVEWTGMLLAGAGLMLVGLLFKVAAAPFHVWTPDVYEGAPSVVTGWMSTGPKAAAFAAFLRIFVITFAIAAPLAGDLQEASIGILSSIAAFTMIFGNVVAMVQDNIKRMLAYSSIAHAGYALVGLIAGDWQSVAFYMLAYAVMNVGAFAVVATIARRADRATTVDDYRGIGFDNTELSVALSIFMVSLAGFPLTAGFIGKLLVFKAAWQEGFHALVIIGVLMSAASVYYYLRPIVAMFFGAAPQGREPAKLVVPAATSIVLTLCMVFVFFFGILPDKVLQFLYPLPAAPTVASRVVE